MRLILTCLLVVGTASAALLEDGFDDPNLDGWNFVVDGVGVVEHEAGQGARAPGSARMWTPFNGGQAGIWQCVNVAAGQTYVLDAQGFRSGDKFGECHLHAWTLDAPACPNGAGIIDDQSAPVLTPDWEWVRVPFTVPAGGQSVFVFLEHDRTAGSGLSECFFDDVRVDEDAIFGGDFDDAPPSRLGVGR